MAIGANDIALFNLSQNCSCCHLGNAVQFIFFYFAFFVVKIHNIVRIENATISAGACLHLTYQLSALQVRTGISIKILPFVVSIMITS